MPLPMLVGLVNGLVCVSPSQGPAPDYALAECAGSGPAQQAGIREGDVIVAVNGTPTDTFPDVVKATQPLTGTAEYTVERDGETLTLPVPVTRAQRWVNDPDSTQFHAWYDNKMEWAIAMYLDMPFPTNVTGGGSGPLEERRIAPRRHGSGTNGLFLDGHADLVPADEITVLSRWDDGDYPPRP